MYTLSFSLPFRYTHIQTEGGKENIKGSVYSAVNNELSSIFWRYQVCKVVDSDIDPTNHVTGVEFKIKPNMQLII